MNKENISKVINKDFFLYGGISKEEYKSISDWRRKTNRRNWTAISGMATVCMVIVLLTSFSVDSVRDHIIWYELFAAGCLVSFILFSTAFRKSSGEIITVMSYITILIMLGFGVIFGTVISPDQLAVAFNVMVIVLPLLICDRPWRISMIMFLSTVVYIGCCLKLEAGVVREMDMYNALVFCGIGIVITYYNSYNKMNAAVNLIRLQEANLTDSLTGLGNRKAFDKYVEDYIGVAVQPDVAVASIDINGFKRINDRYGHAAGDELIVKAAGILKECFEGYGQVYRIGGDEFFAGFYASENSIMLIEGTLRAKAKEVEIDESVEISFSVGFATASEYPGMSVEQLTRVSDRRMYENKRKYYSAKGKDRRGSGTFELV